MSRRVALLIATEQHQDSELRRLTAPGADVAALAAVLANPGIAGFEVTTMVDEPHHRVGEALGDFYSDRRADDITLLYFTGHGLKDEEGRLYLAMTNTRRDSLLFTALAADQVNQAIARCASRQQVLVLDCCYSGAFPVGQAVKADSDVHSLERFRGRGRTVLTASDSTRYSFEGNRVHGQGAGSVFTRHLVEGLSTGEADLNGDGDITLDELYSYVHDRVVAEQPRQRPKYQTDIEGRTVIARNVSWELPIYLRNALRSPIATDRLSALDGLAHLHRIGNEQVRERAVEHVRELVDDDSRSVSAAATSVLQDLVPGPRTPPEPTAVQGKLVVDPLPLPAEPQAELAVAQVSPIPADLAAPTADSAVTEPVAAVVIAAAEPAELVGIDDSEVPVDPPPTDERIPVMTVVLLACGAASMIVSAIPAVRPLSGLGSLLALAGLVAIIFQCKRDRHWVTATAVNLVGLLLIPSVLTVQDSRVLLMITIAAANLVVALLIVGRSWRSWRRGWWIVPAWTGAFAVAMAVATIVVATAGASL